MKSRLIVYLILCLLAACQHRSPETGQPQELEGQVLQVHDEAMAEMDRIFLLRQHLRKLRDTLQTSQPDPATQKLVDQHITLLQKADEAMMNWMHQYRAPAKEQAQDSAKRYLQQQLHKIKQVKKTMDSTLEAAQQIYNQHELKK
jgi:succinate dehydrogenase flavin-adding protein (antitoxin of CptAB toxin-antitoxin module)